MPPAERFEGEKGRTMTTYRQNLLDLFRVLAAVMIYVGLVFWASCAAEPWKPSLDSAAPPQFATPSPKAISDARGATVLSDTAAPVVPQLSPIQAALAKLTVDLTAYETTAGSLALAQATLAAQQAAVSSLTLATSASQQAVAADQQALAALTAPIPSPTPVNPPGPVVPVVSILAITDTATCAPCRLLQPTLDELKAAGVPIRGPRPSEQWSVTATPTLILLVDDKEPGDASTRDATRVVGFDPQLDSKGKPVVVNGHQRPKQDLLGWYQANLAYVKEHSK